MIFDGEHKIISLEEEQINVSDIWSGWVDWYSNTINTRYLPALKQVGGESIGGGIIVPKYIFLLNGWKIRPMEKNHVLNIVGNISTDDLSLPITNTIGNFSVIVQYTVPVSAQGYETKSSAQFTPKEMWEYSNRTLSKDVFTQEEKDKLLSINSVTPKDIWDYTDRTLTESLLSKQEHDKLMSLDTIILRKILCNTKEIKNNHLFIYDDDDITVLFSWVLKDRDGIPSENVVFRTEKL